MGISVDDLERIMKAGKEGTANSNPEQALLANTLMKLAEKWTLTTNLREREDRERQKRSLR